MVQKDEKKKIDAETYWNKKKFIPNWSKIFLTFIYVSFIILVGVFGINYYIKSHDLTFIKFKINPEFGFVVDGKDKVVYYVSLNDDAKSIYNLDMFKGKNRSDALAKAIDVAKENNFLVDGEEKAVTITVVSDEKEKVEELEKKVNEDIKKTDKEIQSTFEEATKEEVEQLGKIELDRVPELDNKPILSGNVNKPNGNGSSNVGKENEGSCSTIGSKEQRCSYTKLVSQDMSGNTRYDTAVKVSDSVFGKTSDNVIIVNSEDYVDGYLATSLSLAYGAPVLFTSKDTIDAVIEKEIKSLKAKNVYIIGGTGVVSDTVESKIKNLLPESSIIRVKGTDRFLTSISVAETIEKIKSFNEVFLVPSSESMIDAGLVSSISGKLNIPILYTKANEFNSSVKEYIAKERKNKIKTIYLVSGLFNSDTISAISKFAEDYDIDIVELKGKDRYKTNAAILNYFDKTKRFDSVTIVNNQVDLIVASSFAAKNGSALFYVGDNHIDSGQASLISKNNKIKKLYYFGGDDIKVAYRNMAYEIKKSNVSKCDNPTKELLYMNKHAVIYVPHQDDESSHLGQFITGAVERLGSNNVHLVVMTDGNGSAIKNEEHVISILKKYNLTLTQARDREFVESAKSLCVGDYKFVEQLNLNLKRFPDPSLNKNVDSVKKVMKYYDELYRKDGGVTHFTYTNFDSHNDHNTLGSSLSSLYFDTAVDDNSFSDVYLAVKYAEYEGTDKNKMFINKKIPSAYYLRYSNPTSWPYMLNAFDKYKQHLSDDGDNSNDLLGMGYESASTVFDEFTMKMTESENLYTPIHVPFKK